MTGPDPTAPGWPAPEPTPPPAPFGVPGQFTPPQDLTPPPVPAPVPPAHQAPPSYGAPAPTPPSPASDWKLTPAGIVQFLGALAALVGVFLPWLKISMSMPDFGDLGEFGTGLELSFGDITRTANGFDDSNWGQLVAILAVGLALLAFAPRTVPALVPIVLSVVTLGVGAYRWSAIKKENSVGMMEALGMGIDVQIGIGLFVVMGGALLALIGALPRLRRPA